MSSSEVFRCDTLIFARANSCAYLLSSWQCATRAEVLEIGPYSTRSKIKLHFHFVDKIGLVPYVERKYFELIIRAARIDVFTNS